MGSSKKRDRFRMNSAIILISGLPLTRKTSFSRQLYLLGEFLKKSKIDSIITDSREHSESILQKRKIHAAILLGYPDQFPFLTAVRPVNIPIFLWAQFSCPPDPESLGNALPVPLTGKSKDFLFEAGASKAGPVIPHGIDTSIYYPISNEERNKVKKELGLDARYVVGTVGANTHRKKFDKIIETFALFAKKNSDTLLLIKTDRVVSIDGIDLDKIARKLDVYSRTKIIVEEMSEQEMRALYGCMDLYINLSEWEGFCIPIIEAMACGTPVVSLPIQGPGEILPYRDLMVPNYALLKAGKTVLFIADPKKTEPVLTYARSNPSLLERAKQLGIQSAKEQYDIHRVVKLWIELLEKPAL
jgi:glycosyltransferase involved in cell wall biosynthesis